MTFPLPSWAARSLLFGPWRAEAATVQYMRDRAVAGQLGAPIVVPVGPTEAEIMALA